MYVAYGWPQVIPLEQGNSSSSQRIVYLKLINSLLLVVSPVHIELWSSSQHKLRLGKYRRDAQSLETEGENLRAVWSPDTKLIAVLANELPDAIIMCLNARQKEFIFFSTGTHDYMTSYFYLHIFKVQFTEKKLQTGGRHSSGVFLASINLVLHERVPFAGSTSITSNFVCDNKHLLIGLCNGSLHSISWKGEFYGSFELDPKLHVNIDSSNLSPLSNGVSAIVACGHYDRIIDESGHHLLNNTGSKLPAIMYLELCLPMRQLFVVYSDGNLVLYNVGKKGLKQVEFIKAEKVIGSGDAVCASVAGDLQILAVGTNRGIVELYDLGNAASLIRTVCVFDWGHSFDDTGPVSSIAWTPDNSAFAVGWKSRGLTVWSVSGCRLMSTFRQVGLNVSSPVFKQQHGSKYEPLISGTSLIQWDDFGYKLYVIEEGSLDRIITFSFGKCCLSRGVSGLTLSRQVIFGEDRLLVVHSENTDELKFLHLNLPVK